MGAALAPTKTYAEGMGGGTSERSPEDRRFIRSLKSRFPGRVTCALIGQESGEAKNAKRSDSLVEFKPEMLKQAPELALLLAIVNEELTIGLNSSSLYSH